MTFSRVRSGSARLRDAMKLTLNRIDALKCPGPGMVARRAMRLPCRMLTQRYSQTMRLKDVLARLRCQSCRAALAPFPGPGYLATGLVLLLCTL